MTIEQLLFELKCIEYIIVTLKSNIVIFATKTFKTGYNPIKKQHGILKTSLEILNLRYVRTHRKKIYLWEPIH